MKKPFNLSKEDRIIHAWASAASGPGWSNRPILVLVMNEQKDIRIEYLQPGDQDYVLAAILYDISEGIHASMTSHVRRLLDASEKE